MEKIKFQEGMNELDDIIKYLKKIKSSVKKLDKDYKNNFIHVSNKKIKFKDLLHLFSFKTPILVGKKIRKNIKSIVGISPTMVLLFHLPCFYLKM